MSDERTRERIRALKAEGNVEAAREERAVGVAEPEVVPEAREQGKGQVPVCEVDDARCHEKREQAPPSRRGRRGVRHCPLPFYAQPHEEGSGI